ncbi:hypothetical protein A9Q83_14940 [Alphaproteobacteria bacterium 46_93_T64]|nr:hypothetical protein A9Q83_14940 [Alphaproteobacteria bacterium 46_93_T64]
MSLDHTDGLHYLEKADTDFAHALTLISPLPDRIRPAGFEQLCKIIIEQQVSLASAAAIWRRLIAAVSPFTPEKMLELSEEQLRARGLGRHKARYCRALANDIISGTLSLEALDEMNDDAAMSALTEVKGIGRWTAEIYLFSCLGRTDIWPAGDVALQAALQHLKKLPTRPGVAEMDKLAEPLRPHRTLAAQILWRYYSDVVRPSSVDTDD